MPLRDNSVDLIITSPPYLTRIDYAVTTAPEIIFLGCSTKVEFHRLRRTIMGSTCISGGCYDTIADYTFSVDQVEKLTGLDFFGGLPAAEQNRLERFQGNGGK